MQTKAYQLGHAAGLSVSGVYTASERNDQLTAAGYDLSDPKAKARACHEFRQGYDAALDVRHAAAMEKIIEQLGPGTHWRVTAEHVGGASVGHPCTTGVYSDPTDDFSEIVTADTEEAALAKAEAILGEIAADWPACDCKRRESPDGRRWWDSVAISVERI